MDQYLLPMEDSVSERAETYLLNIVLDIMHFLIATVGSTNDEIK
jgi:hypothetical protein